MQQTADDHGLDFPCAKDHVYKSFYVDDSLAGADTHQEASKLQQQLRSLLLKVRFNLRKRRSSSTAGMESIPQELHVSSQVKGITMETSKDSPNALGIHWDSTNHSLYVCVGTISVNEIYTKRQVITDIARTFDVLGWFSPVTILMKIMFQKLWELKLEWDEEVPHHIQEQHSLWRSQLHS